MRVTRSFILLLGVAIAAAGCARRPGASVAVAPSGVDNLVYGGAAPPLRGNESDAVAFPAPAPYAAAPYEIGTDGTAMGYADGPYAGAFMVAKGPYTLDSGDRLRIVVYGQEGLTNSYLVDASGHIAVPLIGAVLARGATTEQLSNRIAEKLRNGFIREPHVAVEVEAYRPFFILGEVAYPGQYPYVANMSVETAVAIAGGFTPRAFRRTVILDRTFNGRQIRVSVPVGLPMRPGDTINVQERWF
jgi:polysaccharide biosynthesis/export protein